MFLQYAVMGAWVPLFTLLLKERNFSPQETAWCCATAALGALLAPLPWGQIADRHVPAQRCISFCSLVCGICLLVLSDRVDPVSVFVVSMVYWFFMYPVVSLGTTLTFRHLADPQREFGPVRMWGTIGWMVGSWIVAAWFHVPDWLIERVDSFALAPPQTADCLRIGAVFAFLLAGYALTLPDTPPSPRRADQGTPLLGGPLRRLFEAPLLAFSMLRNRSIAVLSICMFGIYVTIPFNSQLTPLVLDQLGVSRPMLPLTLTLAQSLEVATLWGLPLILFRLKEKGTLIAGMLSWAAVMVVMSLGQPLWLVIASLGLNGIFICCFIVAAQMVVNRQAPRDVKASAQGMLQIVNGLGLLIGHVLVGVLRDHFSDDFSAIFSIAAIVSGGLTLLFMANFRSTPETPTTTNA